MTTRIIVITGRFLLCENRQQLPKIACYFILKADYRKQNYQWTNLILWLIGFIIYRILLIYSFPLGRIVTTIIIIIAMTWGTSLVVKLVKAK